MLDSGLSSGTYGINMKLRSMGRIHIRSTVTTLEPRNRDWRKISKKWKLSHTEQMKIEEHAIVVEDTQKFALGAARVV